MHFSDLNSKISSKQDVIKHLGKVSNISDGVITVSILGNTYCDACNAKTACGTSDSGIKEINIDDNSQTFELYETVAIVIKKDLGLKAVFWAYVLPFLMMMATLIVVSNFFKEWIAGLVSLLILIPYYSMLYIFKNAFKKVYNFSIFKVPFA